MSFVTDIKLAIHLITDRDKGPRELTHEDVIQLRPLACRIHGLAYRHKIHRALPKQKSLRKLLTVKEESGPVQFVSSLNVPGDWDTSRTPRTFMLCVPDEWYDAMATLLFLAEQIEGESPAEAEKPKKLPGQSARQQLESLLGEDDEKILEIARSSIPTDAKMEKIFDLDRRCAGWTAQRWGDLLGVSDGAIRAKEFWKRMRHVHRSVE